MMMMMVVVVLVVVDVSTVGMCSVEEGINPPPHSSKYSMYSCCTSGITYTRYICTVCTHILTASHHGLLFAIRSGRLSSGSDVQEKGRKSHLQGPG